MACNHCPDLVNLAGADNDDPCTQHPCQDSEDGQHEIEGSHVELQEVGEGTVQAEVRCRFCGVYGTGTIAPTEVDW